MQRQKRVKIVHSGNNEYHSPTGDCLIHPCICLRLHTKYIFVSCRGGVGEEPMIPWLILLFEPSYFLNLVQFASVNNLMVCWLFVLKHSLLQVCSHLQIIIKVTQTSTRI